MFSKLHDRIGTAGLVVAIVALVAALGGTAFAAAGLNGKQKKEVKKIAKSESKKWSKKFAKPGPQGKEGAQGPQGPQGDKGDKGDPGAPGSPGSPGAKGATGENGTNGNDGATGATGATGPEGVCSTSGCTLPTGVTETGLWAMGKEPTEIGHAEFRLVPLSFTIPLNEPLSGVGCLETEMVETEPAVEKEAVKSTCHVHMINKEGKEQVNAGKALEYHPACPGTVAEPEAAAGHLCIYIKTLAVYGNGEVFNGRIENGSGAVGGLAAGAFIKFLEIEAGEEAHGTWAVTGF